MAQLNPIQQRVANWPELRSFKEHLEAIQSKPHCGIDILRAWPELLWVLQDGIPATRYRGFSADQLKAYLDKQSTQAA